MLSVCMIVKNESQHLENTLRSIARHVDDIVVVDTGSTDDTKAIAQRFTDKVHDFAWVSDFAAARNFSLSFAAHDWVLVVDADEEIVGFDKDALATLFKTHPTGVGKVDVLNQVDDADGPGVVKEAISRLFRKDLYHYQGIIHEQIVARSPDSATLTRFNAPIALDHVGYTQALLHSKGKLARNIALLQKALDAQPEEPYLHYQLGRSYFLEKAYRQAADCFDRAIRLQTNFSYSYNDILLESYGYALINLGEHKKAVEVLAYEQYCYSTDFMFLKALIFMNNGQLQAAVDTFLLCTKMAPGRNQGVNDFKANYNIGVILECSNMKEKALELYRKCGNYPPALAGIARIQPH